MVAGHLHDAQPACRDAALCVASELATNAVVHARTPYIVGLHMGEVLRIEVTDAGLGAPVLRSVALGAEGGRGLLIVSELSGQWGVDWIDDCKVVWAEIPLSVHTAAVATPLV
jgi:anti-sigma regulatory factor (Ser/Thr protein kinase)